VARLAACSLARCCAARGFALDVFERSGEALASRGAGIVSHPELFEALAQAGATLHDSLGVEVVGRIVLDRNGAPIGEHTLPQIMLSWDRLYSVLREAFPEGHYHAGRARVSIRTMTASPSSSRTVAASVRTG
jgi:2-polyprenyl-6-methoxyphenol hydroxylase-like FAD-dependent oxidoreductase